MKRSLLQFGVAAVAATLFLSGCSGVQADHFFDQAQQNGDTIPDVVTAADIEHGSSRHLGRDRNGTDYFVARSLAQQPAATMVCLVMVGADGQWSQGCSDTLPLTVSVATLGQATLYPESLKQRQPNRAVCTGDNECVGDYVQVQPLSP